MTKFRTVGPARTVGPSFSMAGRQRTRDQEDPDTIEIHNHIPEGDNQRDDEGEEGDEDGVVARYPSTYHVTREGDQIVVYSRAPREGNDETAAESNLSFDHARTHDHGPPRSLFALNEFYRGYYGRRKKTAAR